MQATDVLRDGFDRVRGLVASTADGLGADDLAFRPGDDANSIAWLLWHLSRVQDDHLAEVMGEEQLWASGEWPADLGLPADPADTGYGHTSAQVAAIRPDRPEPLIEYHDAVSARTIAYLDTLDADDLDRVVDRSYDPPVTLGVRLMSVVDDSLQHVGQAGYLRGLLDR